MAGKPVDELWRARQTESSTIMSEFKAWLDAQTMQVPPTSIIGKAVQYTLNQWSKLPEGSPQISPYNINSLPI